MPCKTGKFAKPVSKRHSSLEFASWQLAKKQTETRWGGINLPPRFFVKLPIANLTLSWDLLCGICKNIWEIWNPIR